MESIAWLDKSKVFIYLKNDLDDSYSSTVKMIIIVIQDKESGRNGKMKGWTVFKNIELPHD